MPIRSKAQARFEFAHPETFDPDRVRQAIHAAGGMKGMPSKLSKDQRKKTLDRHHSRKGY